VNNDSVNFALRTQTNFIFLAAMADLMAPSLNLGAAGDLSAEIFSTLKPSVESLVPET